MADNVITIYFSITPTILINLFNLIRDALFFINDPITDFKWAFFLEIFFSISYSYIPVFR